MIKFDTARWIEQLIWVCGLQLNMYLILILTFKVAYRLNYTFMYNCTFIRYNTLIIVR